MSNEINCNLLEAGPHEPVMDFTKTFTREGFNGHVQIPPGAQPREQCDPFYRSRQLGIDWWGARFMYANPGIRLQTQEQIQEILRDIAREGYEQYVLPAPPSSILSLTFTTPSDPPSLWIKKVIGQQYDAGLKFMFRWRDLDNYWRCAECCAVEGFCTRVGAYWSVDAGPDPKFPHVASWYGRNPCKCQKKTERRSIWDGSKDNLDYGNNDEICSVTAIHEGNNVIRATSTLLTGIRTMTRIVVQGDPDKGVIDMNRERMSDRNRPDAAANWAPKEK
jgi:hypothetical protein